MNCYHWLLCLSFFVSLPPDTNIFTSQRQNPPLTNPEQQAWIEYDNGFSELCPNFKDGQRRSQKCSERARQRLRNWLDKQAETCLKTEIPSGDPITTRGCHPAADAVFSYIVRYRESE